MGSPDFAQLGERKQTSLELGACDSEEVKELLPLENEVSLVRVLILSCKAMNFHLLTPEGLQE
jgi:hypothetical protein